MDEVSSSSWVKLMRSNEAFELLTDPPAFLLLTLIAIRARRTDVFNRHGLASGQAFVGDYKACGLSEQQYRTAKAKLEKWGFATFKATNSGTVATLTNTRVFDINADSINGQNNSPSTDKQRTANGQATTNNNDKNDNNEKKGKAPLVRGSAQWISYEEQLTRWRDEFRNMDRPDQHEKGTKRYSRYYELKANIERVEKLLDSMP